MDNEHSLVLVRFETISAKLDLITKMIENLGRPRDKTAVDEVIPRRQRLLKRSPNRARPESVQAVMGVIRGMDYFRVKDICHSVYGPLFDRRQQMQVSAALKFLGFERYRSPVIVDGQRPEMWRKIAPGVLDREQKRTEKRAADAEQPVLNYEITTAWEDRVRASIKRRGVEPVRVEELCVEVSGKVDAAERVKVCKIMHAMGMYETSEGARKVWKMPPGMVPAPRVVVPEPALVEAPNVVRSAVERALDGGTVTRFSVADLAATVFPGRFATAQEFSWLRGALIELRYSEQKVVTGQGLVIMWCRADDDGIKEIEE